MHLYDSMKYFFIIFNVKKKLFNYHYKNNEKLEIKRVIFLNKNFKEGFII